MTKRHEETWNAWIFRKFRSGSEANFQKFLDKFFEKGTNYQDYKVGIKEINVPDAPEKTIEKDLNTQESKKINYLF